LQGYGVLGHRALHGIECQKRAIVKIMIRAAISRTPRILFAPPGWSSLLTPRV